MRMAVINTKNSKTEALAVIQPEPIARIDKHPAAVYLAGLAEGSRRSMLQALNVTAGLLSGGKDTAGSLNWAGLRYQHTQAVRAELEGRYSPASANKFLSALRGVLKEAWRLGLIASEDYRRAVDLKPVKGERLPKGRAVTSGELRSLFFNCQADNGPAGRRDAGLIAILYAGGLRRSEAVALDLEDYEAGAVRVRHGKGNKARQVYLSEGAQKALESWLGLRGSEAGPLFLPVNKGGKVISRRLTAQAIFKALGVRALRAGVASFTPHDLRRSFVGDLLEAGADISTVQKLAGHSKTETTQRYDRRGEETKKKASALLHVPF